MFIVISVIIKGNQIILLVVKEIIDGMVEEGWEIQ